MRKLFSKMDKPLLFVIITFFIFGLVMVLSASSMESYMRYGYGPFHYFFRQAVFLLVGAILFLIVIGVPTKVYKKLSFLMMLGIIGCLIALMVYGKMAHNAQSWFKLGGISIQPSEFAKVIVILFLAGYYGKRNDDLDNVKTLIIPIILVILVFGLVLLQPDLGTALIIGGICFLMFFSLPMSRKLIRKFSLLVIGLIGVVILTYVLTDGKILKEYQKARFNFFDPCERYQEESGYQLCNSFIAFTNGGMSGQGIGKSTQKYLYLPESYTDFIFPIIVEEWGAWVGSLIVVLYAFVIYRIYKIAREASDLHGSLIAYGVCVYLFLHVVINLLGVMGLAPLTGVPLPFLSYGGSYVISLIISLAIVERIAIENNTKKMIKKKKKRT